MTINIPRPKLSKADSREPDPVRLYADCEVLHAQVLALMGDHAMALWVSGLQAIDEADIIKIWWLLDNKHEEIKPK